MSCRSPQSHNWHSVADRINELEKQYTNQNLNGPNQRYTYLDPTKTTRVSNTALKAFQKNAVQSYFERQQQQQLKQQQSSPNTSPSKDSTYATANNLRPQSLPIIKKTSDQMQMIAQSRSSLPTKLAQTINVSIVQPPTIDEPPQNALTRCATANNKNIDSAQSTSPPSSAEAGIYHQPIFSTVVHSEPQLIQKLQQGVLDTRIMTIEQSNLQAANESGVPPPPPRRAKPSMPVRR